MDDTDDDFGDLYGDLNCEMKNYSNGIGAKINDFEAFDNERVALEDENGNDFSESDDDDFRIVLNSNVKGGRDVEKINLNKENDGMLNGSCRESKHLHSNLEGFPASRRASTSGRGAASAQTSGTFCLPRNRTIFDVNAEAFEQRPWSHHGTEITDYFNYGLDEDSWKSYWESMNHYKNQACMSNGFPICQSSMMNQGGTNYSFRESLDKGGSGFDMDRLPKGRAIEVESGLGERKPTIDTWRPVRTQDPDVVIQINIDASEEDELALDKNSLEHAKDHKHATPTSRNYSNERMLSPHPDAQIQRNITSSGENYSPELTESNFRSTSKQLKTQANCIKNDEDLLTKDSCMQEETSDSRDQASHQSKSYDIRSSSNDSKDMLSMKKRDKPINKTSVKEVHKTIDSDHYLSYGSVSDAISEEENNTDKSIGHDISSGEHKHFIRRKLHSVAEIDIVKGDFDSLGGKRKKKKRNSGSKDNYSYHETEMSLYERRKHATKHHRETSCFKKSQKCDRYRNWVEEDCLNQRHNGFSERNHHINRDEEVCLKQRDGEHSKRHHRNWDEEDCLKQRKHDHSERLHHRNWGEEDRSKQRDLDIFDRRHYRNWDEEDCLKQAEGEFSERRHRERGRKSLTCKHSDKININYDSFYPKRDSFLHLSKEKDDHCTRMETEREDILLHHRYRDQSIEDMHRRQLRYNEMEDNFNIKFNRQVFPTERVMRSPERNRYNRRLKFANRSNKYINDDANHRSVSHRHGEFSNTNERACFSSPKEHVHISWGSNGRYVNREHCNISDLQVKNKRNELTVQSIKDLHHLPYEDCLEPDFYGYVSEDNLEPDFDGYMSEEDIYCENVVSTVHMRRFNRLMKPSLHPQLSVLPSHERFLLKKRSKHNNVGGRKPFTLSQRLNGDHILNNIRKIRVDARNPVNVDPHMGKHEVAVNNHLNGLKGKLGRRCNGVTSESKNEINTSYNVDTHQKNSMHPRKNPNQEALNPHTSKGECSNNKVKTVEDHEVEEGEFIEGLEKKIMNNGKKNEDFLSKDSSLSVRVAGLYNNNRILETLKKMEKRMERFKEPITPKQDREKKINPQVDVSVAVAVNEVKEQRPIRKRRWGGN